MPPTERTARKLLPQSTDNNSKLQFTLAILLGNSVDALSRYLGLRMTEDVF